MPGVGHNLLVAGLDDVEQLVGRDLLTVVQLDGLFVGDGVVAIGRAVLELQHLSLIPLNLLGSNVLSDIGTTDGQHDEVTEYVLGVDGNRGGLGTYVNHGAARTLLIGAQHGIGQHQRRHQNVGHAQTGGLHTLADVVFQSGTGHNVEEAGLDVFCLHAYGIFHLTVAHKAFLLHHLVDVVAGVVLVVVAVEHHVHHVRRDLRHLGELALDAVLAAVERLSAQADIDALDVSAGYQIQSGDDRSNGLGGLLDVLHCAFVDAILCRFIGKTDDLNVAVRQASAGDGTDGRGAQFHRNDDVVSVSHVVLMLLCGLIMFFSVCS